MCNMLTKIINIVIFIIIAGPILLLAYARFPLERTLMSLGQNLKQTMVQVFDTCSAIELPTIGYYFLIVFLTALGFHKLLDMYKIWQNGGARNDDLEDESDVSLLMNQDCEDESA